VRDGVAFCGSNSAFGPFFFLFGPEQDVKEKMARVASQKNLLILARAMQFGLRRFGFMAEGGCFMLT